MLDLGTEMLTVHPHDAGVVHHLDQDHHIVVGLYDSLEVVVHTGNGRCRPAEAEDATLAYMKLFHVVVRAGSLLVDPPRGAIVAVGNDRMPAEQRRQCLLPLRRHRWELTVVRIDDDRGRELGVDAEGFGAGIDPEAVVAADVAPRAGRPVSALGRCQPIGVARL